MCSSDLSARDLPEVVYGGNTLTLTLEPREVRVINFSEQPKEWSALKRLQARTADDFHPPPAPKPVPVEGHPLLGVWEYKHGGGTYTREFRKDGTCVLRQGGTEVWTKPFKPDGPNALVVEGHYRHELKPDGTLLIEGRYTASRVK